MFCCAHASPNDFTVGDGLNTAGIRFTRRYYGLDVNTGETYDTNNRNQLNVRIWTTTLTRPTRPVCLHIRERFQQHADCRYSAVAEWLQWQGPETPQLYSFSLVSTLSSNTVNELRIGYRGHDIAQWAPWYVARQRDVGGPTTSEAKEALELLPQYNGIPMQVVPTIFPQGFMQFNSGFAAHSRFMESIAHLWRYDQLEQG